MQRANFVEISFLLHNPSTFFLPFPPLFSLNTHFLKIVYHSTLPMYSFRLLVGALLQCLPRSF